MDRKQRYAVPDIGELKKGPVIGAARLGEKPAF